jgi:hypothetical protein
MSPTRLTAAMLLGLVPALVLSGSVLGQEGPTPDRPEGVERAEANAPAPDFPPGPGRMPPGPMRRRLQPPSPPGPLGPMPGRPGPRDQRGPRRPIHPPVPPRWPFHNWETLERTDPQMYKLLKEDYDLERRTRELAIQYRRASGDQRAPIRAQLEDLVDKHFQARQARRLLELERLEEELKRLRDAIERRDEARQTLVADRVAELLGEENNLNF